MEEALSRAQALEKKYQWLEARDQYEQALDTVDEKDFLRKGELQEKIGYCLHRAGFQAESQELFGRRLEQANEAYEKARGCYESLGKKDGEARMSRCMAIGRYLRHWLVPEPSEKKRLLDECLGLEKNALALFSDLGKMPEYVTTYNELPWVFMHRVYREWDQSLAKKIVEEGIAWGERAVTGISEVRDPYEAAKTHFALATSLSIFSEFIPDMERREQNSSMAYRHLSWASELCERVGDAYLLGLIHVWSASHEGRDERISHLHKALQEAEETRDTFLEASALDYLAFWIYWSGIAAEDPDKKRALYKQAIEFYDRGQILYSVISLISPRGGLIRAPIGHAEHDFHRALLETDRERRLELLESSEKLALKALRAAEESDVPSAITFTIHVLSKTLSEKALLTPDVDAKRSLLEKALGFRERSIEYTERYRPLTYQPLGVYYSYIADIKAGLADIEPDHESTRRLLEEAVQWLEKGLDALTKMMPLQEKRGQTELFYVVVREQYRCGVLLNRLFEVTGNPEHLRRAVESWQRAIETASRLNRVVSIAESYWGIAQAQDALGELSEAAQSFRNASENYVKAAEKIPQLKSFYEDYASYMQAWGQVEEAKQLHGEREYGKAKECYEGASALYKSTQRWNHLSSNYLAWSRLEEAEDESRKEETEKAGELFQQAADLFVDAEKSINGVLGKMENRDEKENGAELVKASRIRREYCLGRMILEEAKILDRMGNHVASSREYASAAKAFQKISEAMQDESDRREIGPIISLCQAWEKMTRAEAGASPELYVEASSLFEEAKEKSIDEKSMMLALGHSYFCKALEAGTRYEVTRDTELYSAAKKHIEAATNYYIKAGFASASEYAKATYMLLDAYMYMHQAETQAEPAKKARYYQMAERLLQGSAGAYVKARHPEKNEQIQRILENIRERSQLTLTLCEILDAPSIASTTTSFSTPSQTREQAVGLERFENADIQANLMPRDQEAKLGDVIRLKVDLVNAGRGGAQLIKVAELLPEGFDVVEKPEMYLVEDHGLNLKGKSLAPLRTEELNLVLKPLDKGTYQIRPRILYLDESGKYKSHEPEPATIVVKELGISGWLKGPTRDK